MKTTACAILLLLAACTIGSATTKRAALKEPAVRPDGAFADAMQAAESGNAEAFRFLLSPRFIHECVLPNRPRRQPKTTEAFDEERVRLQAELKPFESTVQRLVAGYMQHLRELTASRFTEVGIPSNDIRYHAEYDVAYGPNRATVVVSIWAKGQTPRPASNEPAAANAPAANLPPIEPKPEKRVTVRFVQDRQRWLIDGFDDDPLKGTFSR